MGMRDPLHVAISNSGGSQSVPLYGFLQPRSTSRCWWGFGSDQDWVCARWTQPDQKRVKVLRMLYGRDCDDGPWTLRWK